MNRDAVCHELVHAMIIMQCGHLLAKRDEADPCGPAGNDENAEAKALDEGLADYFTYAFTGKPHFGVGTNYERSLVNTKRVPWCTSYVGKNRGYDAAPAISGALYDLRGALNLPDGF